MLNYEESAPDHMRLTESDPKGRCPGIKSVGRIEPHTYLEWEEHFEKAVDDAL